ncbi:MAG: hypothetical protein DRQ40_06280 [Gammaproteobacteria bacterium]|nr:MAG: hypothetical protein DRQ40_06280 [Gammaproteobacteria bacterium]
MTKEHKYLKMAMTAKTRKLIANWTMESPMRKKVKPDYMTDAEFTFDLLQNGLYEPDPSITAFDMETMHGFDVEKELIDIMAKELANDIDKQILNDIAKESQLQESFSKIIKDNGFKRNEE